MIKNAKGIFYKIKIKTEGILLVLFIDGTWLEYIYHKYDSPYMASSMTLCKWPQKWLSVNDLKHDPL